MNPLVEVFWLEQAEADLPAHDNWLSCKESVLLARMRFVKRRSDWRLGRWTAKRAAAVYLNLPMEPQALQKIEVRPAPSGVPELFVNGRPAPVTISITHRAGIAACAIATHGAALGCDIEVIEPRGDTFVADYFTAHEQGLIADASTGDHPRLVALLWSAKESALKALRQGLREDTRDLAVTLQAQAHCSEPIGWHPLQVRCAAGDTLNGWWQTTGELVRTVVAAPSPRAPLLLPASDARPRQECAIVET